MIPHISIRRIGAKEKLLYLTRLTQGRLILEKNLHFLVSVGNLVDWNFFLGALL